MVFPILLLLQDLKKLSAFGSRCYYSQQFQENQSIFVTKAAMQHSPFLLTCQTMFKLVTRQQAHLLVYKPISFTQTRKLDMFWFWFMHVYVFYEQFSGVMKHFMLSLHINGIRFMYAVNIRLFVWRLPKGMGWLSVSWLAFALSPQSAVSWRFESVLIGTAEFLQFLT